MRKNMTVVGERTWKELLGISCIDIETLAPNKITDIHKSAIRQDGRGY